MAIIQPVENNWNLYESDLAFYQVTPANGARIEGIFAVRMSSHTRGIEHLPAMGAFICPPIANDNGKASGQFYPLVVNGKTVEVTGKSFVELVPTAEDVEDDKIILNGNHYTMSVRICSYEQLTDKAYNLVRDALTAIAKDYITPERWQAQRVSEARAKVEITSQNHDKARQAWVDAINELDRVRKG